ncbi:uncharacterized protein BO80DRAFT_141802 [Aspergillus ibericus CBS 121593]|uniref:Uncharacterized protein n=1 Tax=Aspergillus ibericus CBS 121593 TaxID=1448316 RepID=A0A395GUZ2_9EURO|nr:hypothetical protein BO80DRAFT_141802 [Aspergillus ibericus CBS 121593]RAK99239.1 hypothetical protein BO80DRAFT_141802 [Aspergillus ibericus CBS 121593]
MTYCTPAPAGDCSVPFWSRARRYSVGSMVRSCFLFLVYFFVWFRFTTGCPALFLCLVVGDTTTSGGSRHLPRSVARQSDPGLRRTATPKPIDQPLRSAKRWDGPFDRLCIIVGYVISRLWR